MPNARDKSKMKNVSVWITDDFKSKLDKLAKKRKCTLSDLIRDLLAEETGEKGNISSQRKDAE